jgi:hypothetical protein
VKLRYHTIVSGRYFKAGEDVPDELVSPAIAKYAVSEEGDAADLEPVKQKPRRYTVSRPERMYPGAKSKRIKA